MSFIPCHLFTCFQSCCHLNPRATCSNFIVKTWLKSHLHQLICQLIIGHKPISLVKRQLLYCFSSLTIAYYCTHCITDRCKFLKRPLYIGNRTVSIECWTILHEKGGFFCPPWIPQQCEPVFTSPGIQLYGSFLVKRYRDFLINTLVWIF